MSISPRIIKRRIKSITNTKKITKAMELVSASKMRRAINAVLASRSYATLAWEAMTELSKFTNPSLHPLLQQRSEIKRILVIVITSDRGLCGGFNTQLLKQVIIYKQEAEQRKQECDFITIGKKGQETIKRLRWNLVAAFTNLSIVPTITEVIPIASLIIEDFKKGIYDLVLLAYTDFVSSLKQVPCLRRLLPFSRIEGLGEVIAKKEKEEERNELINDSNNKNYKYEYLFEPSPFEVLEMMLPRLIETQIYQAILESSASEHSARMLTMKNATEAATEMIDDLIFTFNQARQAIITREIAEISASKAVLE
jgi:F-type H+-transporting ATPase subunit gamma